MKLKIGEKYQFALANIPRILEVKDCKAEWDFWRPKKPYDKEYGTLALVGDKENNHYFIWAKNAVKSGKLTKVVE